MSFHTHSVSLTCTGSTLSSIWDLDRRHRVCSSVIGWERNWVYSRALVGAKSAWVSFTVDGETLDALVRSDDNRSGGIKLRDLGVIDNLVGYAPRKAVAGPGRHRCRTVRTRVLLHSARCTRP